MKIGFIGLGIMGEVMSERIVKLHNDSVYVFDINKEKIKQLEEKGAKGSSSAKELAKNSDVIISMVPNSKNTEDVFNEIKDQLDSTKMWIDMSTISPLVSVEISKKVKKLGAKFLDAPVVKSRPAAESGQLGIYVGSEDNDFLLAKDILAYMGSNIIHMGPNGNGLIMKICHNAMVGQIQNGVNETLNLAIKSGIEVKEFVKAISYGGGQNFYLDSKNEVIEKKDYTTAFSIDNMNKDINLCLDLAKAENVNMPGVENVKNVYKKAVEKGFGKDDFSKTFEIVKDL